MALTCCVRQDASLRVLGLKHHAEPEDVCQSALQAFISRPPRRGFRSESELLAFLREIIRTKAKLKRRRLMTQRRNPQRVHQSPVEVHEILDEDADPAQVAYVSDLCSFIRANIRRFPRLLAWQMHPDTAGPSHRFSSPLKIWPICGCKSAGRC